MLLLHQDNIAIILIVINIKLLEWHINIIFVNLNQFYVCNSVYLNYLARNRMMLLIELLIRGMPLISTLLAVALYRTQHIKYDFYFQHAHQHQSFIIAKYHISYTGA